MEQIPLGSAIAGLREELKKAIADQDEELVFEIRDLELELTVQAGSSRGANGTFAAWFVNLGANGSKNSANTHRLRLTLAPMTRKGDGTTASLALAADGAAPPERRIVTHDPLNN
ncbi:hypothetical protein O1R50_15200 [Glycomyces luteolus]|uniref:Trypsin-co-occurring domain-containing protein n=1 Tax=Glycomyces luteolus TaxID=2670330 RepID=A0A9X3PBG2_9ACTN|nr:trypco2 family protein [Glycomyces luteolus]MDA1360976.1 hypothetical protein [Glycomyces luteolus]